MLYALILTTYIYGYHTVAVAQTTTSGFTTEQACRNAGNVARSGISGIVNDPGTGNYSKTAITFQCAPLSL